MPIILIGIRLRNSLTGGRKNEISIDKYRLHYRDGTGKMIFRYDNAPHHPELDRYLHELENLKDSLF